MDSGKAQDIQSLVYDESQTEGRLPELPSQYEIFEQITSGAMGKVFRARNQYTGAQVAIKIMRTDSTQNTKAIQRFFLEAKAASLLRHQNICRVLDFGVSEGGTPYLVMEWIEGISLERKIEEGIRLSLPESLSLFKQIAMAMAHAHQKKIVHRDLKPANIMVNFNDSGQIEAWLIDFGIAKMLGAKEHSKEDNPMTRIGTAIGTPAYMSPEQARGELVDERTDIYSLGCVMYFVLTGKEAFTGKNIREVMEKHICGIPEDIPASAKVPQKLKAIVFKAMNKDLAKRYASVENLMVDLDQSINPSPSTKKILIERTQNRNKFALILWFVIGFLIIFAVRIVCEGISDIGEQKKSKSVHHNISAKRHR